MVTVAMATSASTISAPGYQVVASKPPFDAANHTNVATATTPKGRTGDRIRAARSVTANWRAAGTAGTIGPGGAGIRSGSGAEPRDRVHSQPRLKFRRSSRDVAFRTVG